MSATVKARIIKVGNSQGVRIPKLLIEQAGLTEDIEIEAQDGQLIIRSAHTPRQGWEEQFRQMAANGADKLLDDEPLVLTEWEASEWEW